MKQTKKQSFIESLCNTVFGFFISTIAAYFIIPLFFNVERSFNKSTVITIVFTVISILRNYIVRRAFNWKGNDLKSNNLKRYLLEIENDTYETYYELWLAKSEEDLRRLFYEDRSEAWDIFKIKRINYINWFFNKKWIDRLTDYENEYSLDIDIDKISWYNRKIWRKISDKI